MALRIQVRTVAAVDVPVVKLPPPPPLPLPTIAHQHPDTKQQRTYGFVRYMDEASAVYACRVLDGEVLFNRALTVVPQGSTHPQRGVRVLISGVDRRVDDLLLADLCAVCGTVLETKVWVCVQACVCACSCARMCVCSMEGQSASASASASAFPRSRTMRPFLPRSPACHARYAPLIGSGAWP